jgi:hypothetical protein
MHFPCVHLAAAILDEHYVWFLFALWQPLFFRVISALTMNNSQPAMKMSLIFNASLMKNKKDPGR